MRVNGVQRETYFFVNPKPLRVLGGYSPPPPLYGVGSCCACFLKAVSSSGGSFFPRFSALFRIPVQALADKEYFGCAESSKICDKRESFSSLGDSPKLGIVNSPSN